MLTMRLTCCLAGWLLLPLATLAQAERHELGRRLRAFEEAFEKESDPAARKRAMPYMDKAVQGFFAGRIAVVGESIEQARHALTSAAPPSPEQQWAGALWFKPARRLIDASAKELPFLLDALYPVQGEIPKDARLRISLIPPGNTVSAEPQALFIKPIDAIPFSDRLPLQVPVAGDYVLRSEILIRGKPVSQAQCLVSVVEKVEGRMQRLKEKVAAQPQQPSLEQATLQHLHGILAALHEGRTLETDYPAHRLLAEAESVAEKVQSGQAYYEATRPGEYWLALPTDRTPTIVRALIPPEAAQRKSLPLVLALHGAGGSENLFFDGYGNGKLVRLCRERGWMLVAPRSGFGRQDLPALSDALAQRYPVDPARIYVVGHSMGAGQALTAAMQHPQRYAAIAALGGGGRVRAVPGIAGLPFFIGIGTKDFAYRSARSLHASLQQAGIRRLEYKEYLDVEHMLIVQVALPDVMEFFAQARRAP